MRPSIQGQASLGLHNNKLTSTLFICLLVTAHIVPQILQAQLNTDDRWIVRDFYNFVYPYGTDFDMGWTGNYDEGTVAAGDLSDAWQEATQMRVNFYRHMAGLTPNITFVPAKNAASQESALVISALGGLPPNHDFPDNADYLTDDAQEAAFAGNLGHKSTGVDAIDGYMVDFGPLVNSNPDIYSNQEVGHRQWILFPQGDTMGNGDVPGNGTTFDAANTLWVQPDSFDININPRQTPRNTFVAWPPKGYVPSDMVWPRWSFSYPNADFSNASVSMTGPNGSITLEEEFYTPPPQQDVTVFPEPVFVWVPNLMDRTKRRNWPTPDNDEVITVNISGVTVDGQPVGPFNYDVKIFDASAAGNDEFTTELTNPVNVTVYEQASFSINSRSWAEGVQGRLIQFEAFADVFDAEEQSILLDARTSDGYDTIVFVTNNTKVYNLAQPDSKDQILTLPGEYFIGAQNPSIEFRHSLGFSSEWQTRSVEINLGDGYGWQTIAGGEFEGPTTADGTFNQVSLPLDDYTNRTASFRFRLRFTGSVLDSWSSGINYYDGWAIDDITLTGVEKVTNVQELPVSMGQDFITATFTSTTPVYLQARDIAFTEMDASGFALDWGPVLEVTPEADGFTLVGTAIDQWSDNPTIGYVYGEDADWVYSYNLGWLYVPHGSWMYSGIGWIKYVSGSIAEGLWLYSPDEGFIYVQDGYFLLFLRSPYAIAPANWGSFVP